MKHTAQPMGYKRIGTVLLLVLLCMVTVSSALAADFGVIYNTNSLNLRSGASSTSGLLGTYKRDTWLSITGSKNNFYYVTTPDGRRGYMSKNYINQGPQAYGQIAIVDNRNGGRFLNFRQSPDYSSRVLGIFFDGVPLQVLSRSGGWARVQINGQTGYVDDDYVRIISGLSSSTVATIKTPNNTAINMRSGPGSGYSVLRQFAGDRYVMVLLKGTGWWKVSIDGYVGFMSSDYLVEGLRSAKDIAAEDQGGPAYAYAVVNNPRATQALNLRFAPDTSSQVLAKLYNGIRLTVNAQGLEWSAVTVEETGLSGYVMTSYLKLHNLPKTPTMKVAHPQGLKVNLRSSPSFNADVLTQLSSGTTVSVMIPDEAWTKVTVGNRVGYIVTYFLQ